jgi:GNAT superfamily N-acetyltransferase
VELAVAGETACFLDDLYVVPGQRRRGAGSALLAELGADAQANGWTVIRWITRRAKTIQPGTCTSGSPPLRPW